MPMPTKDEILQKARAKAIEREFKHGLPAITPTEHELKETGAFREAQRDLMTTHGDVDSESMRYINTMAEELGFGLVGKKELKKQRRKVEAFELFQREYPTCVKKVNGYRIRIPDFSKKPKAKPKKKPKPKPKTTKPKKTGEPHGLFGIIAIPKTKRYQAVKPYGTLKVGRILNLPTNTETLSLLRRGVITKVEPKPEKAKKKRQRNHSERTGKTMRSLRGLNGVKVFSFPDDVWKVRKKRRKKRK